MGISVKMEVLSDGLKAVQRNKFYTCFAMLEDKLISLFNCVFHAQYKPSEQTRITLAISKLQKLEQETKQEVSVDKIVNIIGDISEKFRFLLWNEEKNELHSKICLYEKLRDHNEFSLKQPDHKKLLEKFFPNCRDTITFRWEEGVPFAALHKTGGGVDLIKTSTNLKDATGMPIGSIQEQIEKNTITSYTDCEVAAALAKDVRIESVNVVEKQQLEELGIVHQMRMELYIALCFLGKNGSLSDVQRKILSSDMAFLDALLGNEID